MADELQIKEEKLKERMLRISQMEEEVRKREKALKEKEKTKKQIPLRLASSLYDEIAAWAEEDFRSVNSQIEYLLAECVKHKKGSR